MASNAASCKAWSIALVSAVLVVVADRGRPEYALFALVPTLLFLVLDSYYLALERAFRGSYNEFIDKLHRGDIAASDLYAVSPKGRVCSLTVKSALSFSVWPFYAGLTVMTLAAGFLLI